MRFVSFACLLVCLSACGGNSSTKTTARQPKDQSSQQVVTNDKSSKSVPAKDHQPTKQTAHSPKKNGKTQVAGHAQGSKHRGKRSHSANRKNRKPAHGKNHKPNPSHSDKRGKSIAIGDTVPEFEVTLGGKAWKLSDLRKNKKWSKDGTVVLTFWCSFCHSCRDVERPLDKLAGIYKGQVAVLAIDASYGETSDGVAKFAKKRGLQLPIALNPDGKVADLFGTSKTTTTVVIDKKGVLRYCGRFSDGQHAYAEDAVKSVLAGKPVKVKKTRHRG